MKNYGQADMITVWGSPGSGKSVFSGLLAAMLEHRKKKVIVVSPNIQTPMLPVFFPRESVENRYSLGHISFKHKNLIYTAIFKPFLVIFQHIWFCHQGLMILIGRRE